MLRTAWSPKATATDINPLLGTRERGISYLLPIQYVSNSAPPNTHTFPLSLYKIYTCLNNIKRVICGQKAPHCVLLYAPSLLFFCTILSFIYFLYSSFFAFSFSMTHMLCISMPPLLSFLLLPPPLPPPVPSQ